MPHPSARHCHSCCCCCCRRRRSLHCSVNSTQHRIATCNYPALTFSRYRNSQKPTEDFLAKFQASFPNLRNSTSDSPTEREAAGQQPQNSGSLTEALDVAQQNSRYVRPIQARFSNPPTRPGHAFLQGAIAFDFDHAIRLEHRPLRNIKPRKSTCTTFADTMPPTDHSTTTLCNIMISKMPILPQEVPTSHGNIHPA